MAWDLCVNFAKKFSIISTLLIYKIEVKTLRNEELYNNSGCVDKTAYEALKNIRREERRALINLLKLTAENHGYEITNRIELREIKEVDV